MIPRHEQILETLATHQNASVGDLSALLNVSEVTIRSDLKNLAENGRVIRTHGGARLAEERIRQEYTFQTRKNFNSIQKQKIGKLAASLVNPMESVLIDSSTTAVAMAQAIREMDTLKDLTVIPTGIWTAMELMGSQNINVLLPGGYLRHTTGSISGVQNSVFFKNLNVQKAFLGASGISNKMGVMDNHLMEIDLKKYVVANVPEIIVLADGSKFLQTGLATYAHLQNVSKVITDNSAPKSVISDLRRAGVEVLIAE